MVKIEIDKHIFEVPSKLEELSKRQFLTCVGHLFSMRPAEAKAAVSLSVLPRKARKLLPTLAVEQRADIVEATAHWVDTNHRDCPVKHFWHNGTRYLMPRYERLSVIEAAKAQEYLNRWQDTRKDECLDLLVATLCRPKKLWLQLAPFARHWATDWDGDQRQKYNAELVAQRAKSLKYLSFEVKLAVLWQFSQMMASVKKQFASVFAHRTENSEPGPLIDMVFHLSGSELGDYKAVSHTPLLTVLYLIHTRIAHAPTQ